MSAIQPADGTRDPLALTDEEIDLAAGPHSIIKHGIRAATDAATAKARRVIDAMQKVSEEFAETCEAREARLWALVEQMRDAGAHMAERYAEATVLSPTSVESWNRCVAAADALWAEPSGTGGSADAAHRETAGGTPSGEPNSSSADPQAAVDLQTLLAYEAGLADGRNEAAKVIVRLRAALQHIKDNCGQVCEEFELCKHPACHASCNAWLTANDTLAAAEGQQEEASHDRDD